MSFASFLLGSVGGNSEKGKAIDKGLDDIFRSTATAQPGPSASRISVPVEVKTSSTASQAEKRKHAETDDTVKSKKLKSGKERNFEHKKEIAPRSTSKKSKVHTKLSASNANHEDTSEEEESTEVRTETHKTTESIRVEHDSDETDSDEEGDPSKLIHESLLKDKGSKGASKGKAKFIASDETPELRRARTIFVGNVPVEVVKGKSMQKQFKRHVLSFVPTAKIESIRFRSVAFKSPTSKLPPLDGSVDEKTRTDGASKDKEKEGRQHDRDRAASWRATKSADQEEPGKTFLTQKEKKRIAFIKHEIHEKIDAVNAYIVFAHPPPPETRPANLPPLPPVMDPHEAAKKAAELCDGSVFLERTLRVDMDGKTTEPDARDESASGLPGDPRTTLFVGNLDFASKEEDLRVFFEGLVSAERGPPKESEDEDDDDDEDDEDEEDKEDKSSGTKVAKLRTWVKRVRIIRDKDTQLGKGFAYVQFVDRECVDEIFALDASRLKFAKRKLRVQRCKVIPKGSTTSSSKHPKARTPHSKPSLSPRKFSGTSNAHNTTIPRGNPELGTKIQHLPKEERRKIKASDVDRVARRMAKKKAKLLAEKGVRSKVDRVRVRKRVGEKSAAGPKKEKAKRRVRSDKAISKMNTKK